MPSAVACTHSAPAASAASELATARPRSQCPCQSTRIFSPEGLTTSSITNFTSALTPLGVAWPQVSQITMERAPHSMAALYSRYTVCGSQREVSSVTYITSRPSERASFTASSVVRSRKSSVQSSV